MSRVEICIQVFVVSESLFLPLHIMLFTKKATLEESIQFIIDLQVHYCLKKLIFSKFILDAYYTQ